MKTAKSQDATDEFLDGNTGEQKLDVVGELCEKLGGLPTLEQLATIAATLTRNPDDQPMVVTRKALELWLAAREILFRADYNEEITKQNNGLNEEFGDFSAWIQKPVFSSTSNKYPLTRDSFLREVLPNYKNRTADLARFGKMFIRDTLQDQGGKEPTQDEVNEAYSNWKPYQCSEQANDEAGKFRMWLRIHKNRVRSAAGKNSVAVRKDKKPKLKKPLRK